MQGGESIRPAPSPHEGIRAAPNVPLESPVSEDFRAVDISKLQRSPGCLVQIGCCLIGGLIGAFSFVSLHLLVGPKPNERPYIQIKKWWPPPPPETYEFEIFLTLFCAAGVAAGLFYYERWRVTAEFNRKAALKRVLADSAIGSNSGR